MAALVIAATFLLAQARVFAPSAPATAGGGDVYRGETIFQRECAGCHGPDAKGGIGPRLFEAGLDEADVAAAIEQGRGVMPAGIVRGSEQADVVAFVVSISRPVE